jgi:hypothetical protein
VLGIPRPRVGLDDLGDADHPVGARTLDEYFMAGVEQEIAPTSNIYENALTISTVFKIDDGFRVLEKLACGD